MRAACLLLIVVVLVPLRGVGQPVVGVVLERGAGTPVPAAMLLLFDSAGTRVDRTLTNAAGRFALHAHAPGIHRITVERIGYSDWSTEPFRLEAPGRTMRIEVAFEAITLEGLDVSGGRRCEARHEKGEATARVWEEARKALAAEAYTREEGLYRYTLQRYRRTLDRNADNVLNEQIKAARHMRGAFVSYPVDRLLHRGFVQPTDSTSSYYLPDAATLLSEAFLDTHCFGLREGEGGMIGLTFRPMPDRKVSEIKGVLWLNTATWELERLEFLYQNLLPDREVGKPGGEVSFTRLPNGAWVVREWAVRGPNLELPVGGRLRRVGYTEEAGVTWAITDPRGRAVLHAESASISGVVTDSTGIGPLRETVIVQVPGTDRQAITEGDGSFLLVGLEEGRHPLAVQPPLHASWGLASPAQAEAEGRSGEMTHVRLRVPSLVDVLAASCGGAPRPGGATALLGRITDPGGAPLDRMVVTASWPQASGYRAPAVAAPAGPEGTEEQAWKIGRDGESVTAAMTTDWRGLFLLCDVPGGSRLRVTVRGPADIEQALTETFLVSARAGAVVKTLVVPAGGGPARE